MGSTEINESSGDNKARESEQQPLRAPKDGSESKKLAEGSVEGQVACIEGPMANATVFIGIISTFADPKGNFVLEHIPPGIVQLKVNSPTSRFHNSSTDIIVEAGKRKNIFVYLNEVTGTVEGTIADESGRFLAGAEVSGLFRLGKDPIISKTDQNGHYYFNDIPRGSYFIRASAKGFMTEGASVNVVGGGTVVSDFKLKPGNLSITGKIVNSAGAPIDCEIYLMRKGIVVTRLNTSSTGDGKYAFVDLVSDVYEIGTSAPGYTPKGWFGKLEKAEMVDFELEPMPPPDPQSQNPM